MVDQFSERKRNHQATKTTFLINRVLFSFLPAPGLFFCTSHWPLTSGRQRESPSLASLQLLSSASILNAPVVLFNPDYCRSSSLHTGWSTFRLLKGANTTWLWSHPASVFEGTTATTAQCRFSFPVHQELSFNELWHDWMIWSASMVCPNPYLSVTWSCIMHKGSSQGFTDPLLPSFPSFTLHLLASLHLFFFFALVFPLLPLFHTTCVPPSPFSSSHCVVFAAFRTLTVFSLKERPHFAFPLCLRGLYLAALKRSSPEQKYLALCYDSHKNKLLHSKLHSSTAS